MKLNIAISDYDVDAADLYLVLKPELNDKGSFSGGETVEIDMKICMGCDVCLKECRFDAVTFKTAINGE